MRMGKPDKPRRGVKEESRRADEKVTPKHAARASVVGQLSPDIVSVYFAPELRVRATEGLERYSAELLLYNDILREIEERKAQVEAQADGTLDNITEVPTPPAAPLYRSQYWVDQLEEVFSDVSNHFQSKNGGWKVHAKAAKFERLMEERYGIFRPFLKNHPEMEQFVRSIQRKYANGYFSPFRQGKPPIPKTTAVIILFMMHRGNVRWDVTVLAALFFLVGLQPWALVVIVAGAHIFLEKRKMRPLRPMKTSIRLVDPYYSSNVENFENESESSRTKRKYDILSQPVGKKLGDEEGIDMSKYDTIILGSDPATLYTAALLSRSGRKVLVLSSKPDASGCYVMEKGPVSVMKKFGSIPFDVESSNIAKIGRQQTLLAPALCSTKDFQGGIRFAQIGSETDGYAFEVLSVPGMGGGDGKDSENAFVLRKAGTSSLMEDAAMSLGDGWPGLDGDIGNSTTGLYAATCDAINETSNKFYMSKLLSDHVNGMRSNNAYEEASIRYASAYLDKAFSFNAHTRSLMAAIGMRGENIKPSMTSMGAHVTNVCSALSGEGMHYPIGGPRALCHALATVVEQNGGRIVTEVPVSELLFEQVDGNKSENSGKEGEKDEAMPRCIGVQLSDKREFKFDMNNWHGAGYAPAIISMHGFVTTFIRLLPEEIRIKHKVPRGLPALSERRPVFKILFALEGSSRDLDLTGADFYRLPGAALAQDEFDPVTGQIKPGEIGWIDDEGHEEEEVNSDDVNRDLAENPQGPETGGSSRSKRDKGSSLVSKPMKRKKVKFETGVSWIQISFPSAKDPSFESRHGAVSTCVVTIEADDDFATPFDTKPKLYSIQKGKEEVSGNHQRLMERVRKDLIDSYPQLEGKILHSQMVGPLHRGLSHNPERYAAKGVRPKSPYPGLFLGGSDLTVGESLSGAMVGGWLAANAVMGYRATDYLFLQKNITSDIIRYMETPDQDGDKDLAVPFETTLSDADVGKSSSSPDVKMDQ